MTLTCKPIQNETIMKALIALLFLSFTTLGLQANNSFDKESRNKLQHRKTELRNRILNSKDRPAVQGHVVALVKVNSNGQGQVIESDATTEELKSYVKDLIEKREFRNMCNETIRLVVDFRK